MFRAAADRAWLAVLQARREFGCRVGQALLPDVKPPCAQFLVFFPAPEMALRYGRTFDGRCPIAPDNVHEFVGGRGFLGAEHGLARQQLQHLLARLQARHL